MTDDSLTSKISKILGGITLGILAIIVSYIVGVIISLVFYFQLFGWLYDFIASFTSTGFIGKSLTALVIALLFFLPLGKIVKSFLPGFPQANKKRYKALVFGALALVFFMGHWLRGNDFFDRETGVPLKYYSIHKDSSYHFFDKGGFDPDTGDTLKPATKYVLERYEEREARLEAEENTEKVSIPAPPPDNRWLPLRTGKVINKAAYTVYMLVSYGGDLKKDWPVEYSIQPHDTLMFDIGEGTHPFLLFNADGASIVYEKKYDKYLAIQSTGKYYVDFNFHGRKTQYAYYYVMAVDGQNDWVLLIDNEKITFTP